MCRNNKIRWSIPVIPVLNCWGKSNCRWRRSTKLFLRKEQMLEFQQTEGKKFLTFQTEFWLEVLLLTAKCGQQRPWRNNTKKELNKISVFVILMFPHSKSNDDDAVTPHKSCLVQQNQETGVRRQRNDLQNERKEEKHSYNNKSIYGARIQNLCSYQFDIPYP